MEEGLIMKFFVKDLEHYLSSQLPADVPNRQVFLDGLNNEILGVYQSYFKQKEYLRIIDIRSVAKLKALVFEKLKGKQFEGMNAQWLLVQKIRSQLTKEMKKSLEEFTDLACSEDCSVIEGPALDSWTCLRIRAQCFDGSVCGEDDDRDAEKKELNMYLFLVAEFTLLSSILLWAYIYSYHHCKILIKLRCKRKKTVPLAKKDLEANLEDETKIKHEKYDADGS
ncbi:izumo sperm-egg fusion protein 3 isoform X2 [Pseudophryne corroboree]|uniref:izumo sperm-egg fusion protein 3 isoform X2 n=1 Tax=Pseudophryne corroboree TaxID=495146 RepID=UPI003081E38F